jgi:hypothetical protein
LVLKATTNTYEYWFDVWLYNNSRYSLWIKQEMRKLWNYIRTRAGLNPTMEQL